ncbi:hypothetical protein CBP31_06905 [Oceanisphaera profunda]|uniref:LamB/YcsF family protein n=1 Tax=Oceanisphaera profunda TaxID=1416627 RepID=A0A1Y0D525_9GAMM|nr:LamB/YcsF family protein [Oceanisphaera profunda]ART82384.1 hypothetical protein CBP31_06905 [Oceanisphaera profunda]
MAKLLLNADLGESFGAWQLGQDEAVLPLIDLANIACGFHASDPDTMRRTVRLAHDHQVKIGAHPAYPDLVGFGRRGDAYKLAAGDQLLFSNTATEKIPLERTLPAYALPDYKADPLLDLIPSTQLRFFDDKSVIASFT